MSPGFYGAALSAAVARNHAYCHPRKPSWWDGWKGMTLVFLTTTAILAALLFVFKPNKKVIEPVKPKATVVSKHE